MPTDQEFLRAILDAPDDIQRRLVYADWLQQQNNPRGEFIAAQCALDAAGPDAPPTPENEQLAATVIALRRTHAAEWLAALGLKPGEGSFIRGFVESIVIDGERASALPRALDSSPVRRLSIEHPTLHVAKALNTLPRLEHLHELHFRGSSRSHIGPTGMKAIAAGNRLSNLTALYVGCNALGASGVKALASSRAFGNLKTLDVGWNKLGAGDLGALEPIFARLTYLAIGYQPLGEAGIRHLASARSLARLTKLEVTSSNAGDDGARALANSSILDLTHLRLGNNSLSADGVRALADSSVLDRVETLVLASNVIGTDGVRALAESSHLGALTELDLSWTNIDAAAVLALVRSPRLPALRSLDVGNQQVGAALGPLAECPELARIEQLHLWATGLDDAVIRTLAASPYVASLKALYLGGNRIGPAGARALAESPHLSRLRTLSIYDNALGPEGAEILAHAPGLPSLRGLYMPNNDVRTGARAFVSRRGLPRLDDLNLSSNNVSPRDAEALRAALPGIVHV